MAAVAIIPVTMAVTLTITSVLLHLLHLLH
jgi:hypothetical protein